MTAPAVAITSDEQYQVLRAYAAGRDIADIATSYGMRHDTVSHIVLTMASCRRPIAAASGLPLDTVRAEWAAMLPAPRRRKPTDPAPAAKPAAREPWQGHRCPDCGRTYRHPYSDHGAPNTCPGRLEPVTVGGA